MQLSKNQIWISIIFDSLVFGLVSLWVVELRDSFVVLAFWLPASFAFSTTNFCFHDFCDGGGGLLSRISTVVIFLFPRL